MTTPTVLVLGGTGYVGGRLVPRLVSEGATVRCLTRSADGFDGIDWADDVEIVEGDLFELDSLRNAFDGVDQVVYLVHSLNDDDFEQKELECASNTRRAAERAGVRHIVYLSGLGDDDTDLSAHLSSRHDVGRELAAGPTAVTELRAAIVIGAGSASFEMLRCLTDVLPIMTAPSWVTKTMLQPISIDDVLTYLSAALDRDISADGTHDLIEIGGPDAMTYADLVHLYSDVTGLRRRIIPIPIVSPGFSAGWVGLVTPIPAQLAHSLIDSLENDVVVTDDTAARISTHEPMTTRRAIELAVAEIAGAHDLRPHDATRDPAQPAPWDPDWAGGTLYEDRREQFTTADPAAVQRTVRGIGGQRGWFGFKFLWSVRGLLDRLFGGVGLRRGRLDPDDIEVGDHLDFWRVLAVDDDLFRLRGEMVLPGEAWLEWSTVDHPDGTTVIQRARYIPRGLRGRVYWWVLSPFHAMIFPLMLRGIVAAAEESPTDAQTMPNSDESERRHAPIS